MLRVRSGDSPDDLPLSERTTTTSSSSPRSSGEQERVTLPSNLIDPNKKEQLAKNTEKVLEYCQQISKLLEAKRPSELSFKTITQSLIEETNEVIRIFGISRIHLKVETPRLERKKSNGPREKIIKRVNSHTGSFSSKSGQDLLDVVINQTTKEKVRQACQNIKNLCPAEKTEWTKENVKQLKIASDEFLEKINALFSEANFSLIEKEEVSLKPSLLAGIDELKIKMLDEKKVKEALGKVLLDVEGIWSEKDRKVDEKKLFSKKNEIAFKKLLCTKILSFKGEEVLKKELEEKSFTDFCKKNGVEAFIKTIRLISKEKTIDKNFLYIQSVVSLLENYRWKIWKFAEGLTNIESDKHKSSKKIKKYVPHATDIEKISKWIKAEYIESKLQDALSIFLRALMNQFREKKKERPDFALPSHVLFHHELEELHLGRLLGKGNAKMSAFKDWMRVLSNPNFLKFKDERGNELVDELGVISSPIDKEGYTGKEKADKIDTWVSRIEVALSKRVFGDKEGTLLTNFRKVIQTQFSLSAEPKDSSHPKSLFMHSQIFESFGPIIEGLLSGNLNPLFLPSLQKVQEELQKTNRETLEKIDLKTFASYLFTFYSCLYAEHSIGTMSALRSFYENSFPKDKNKIEGAFGKAFTEEEVVQKIDKWIPSFETVFSKQIFLDETGSFLTNLREVSERQIAKSKDPKLPKSLQAHADIFEKFGGEIKHLSEGFLELSPELEAVLKELKQTNGSFLSRTNLKTFAGVLSQFYTLLFSERPVGPKLAFNTFNKGTFWPGDKNRIENELGIIYNKTEGVAITLKDDMGVIFSWDTSNPFCKDKCLLKHELTIEIPPFNKKDQKPSVSQQFSYEILETDLSEKDLYKIQKRLYRLALLLKEMGFPKDSLKKINKWPEIQTSLETS